MLVFTQRRSPESIVISVIVHKCYIHPSFVNSYLIDRLISDKLCRHQTTRMSDKMDMSLDAIIAAGKGKGGGGGGRGGSGGRGGGGGR